VTRLGSTKPGHTEVRLLIATNRDLKRRVQEERFREDLYYRLAVVPLTVPALPGASRQRSEDATAQDQHRGEEEGPLSAFLETSAYLNRFADSRQRRY
jgi:transcriptional regulator with GAF, ATPase, and Fis domain